MIALKEPQLKMIKNTKIKAILLMFCWATSFVSAMSLNKLVDKAIPTEIIVLYRLFFGFLWLSPFLIKKRKTIYKTPVIHLHLMRSLLTTFTMGCTYYAYRNIPLGLATSIGLSGPLFTTLLAALLLKEKLSLKKISLIITGYLGVLCVVNPHLGESIPTQAIFIDILGNISIGLIIVLMKQITKTDSVETALFYNTFFTLIFCFLYAYSNLCIPSQETLLLLVDIGLLGICTQFFYIKAISYEEASFVSPLEYFRIVVGIPVGLIFFQETIQTLDILGTFIIMATTYYLTIMNQKKAPSH